MKYALQPCTPLSNPDYTISISKNCIFVLKMKIIKKYFSLFFLLLFLFPQVEKGIHDFTHGTGSHCKELSLHFCEKEHSCTLCDYQITPAIKSIVPFSTSFPIVEKEITFIIPITIFLSQELKYNLPSRAPPIA